MDKILAIMVQDPPWMYYVKYKGYLSELNDPFKDRIDFIVDSDLSISYDLIMQYPVVVFYHRDPLKYLYPEVYEYAKRIEAFCFENNIRLINAPDPLSRSIKAIQLDLLSHCGFRVAKSFEFNNINDLENINADMYPLFIRNNVGHDSHNRTMQGPFSDFLSVTENYKDIFYQESDRLKGKVAIQWIDTRGVDGLYRRYRAFVCGNNAITGNLHISESWYIHGINNNPQLSQVDENNDFVNSNYSTSEKDFFVSVNKALGLEFSAIDYAYTRNGELVIWEANPHPAFPAWVDKEPCRSKLTKFLSDYYCQVLEEAKTKEENSRCI